MKLPLISDNCSENSDRSSFDSAKLRNLLKLAWPFRMELAAIGFLALGTAGISLLIPSLAGVVLGGLVGRLDVERGAVLALLLACLVATAFLNFLAALVSTRLGATMLATLRQGIFEHIQRLPIGFHELRGRGNVMALITYEIRRLSDFFIGTLTALPARLFVTVGAVALMFRIDHQLALVVPILIPTFYLLLKVVGRSLRGLAVSIQQAEARVVEFADESLSMLPAIKAFNREAKIAEQFSSETEIVADLTKREGQIYAFLEPSIGLVAAIAAILILLLAGRGVRAGTLNPQQLFSLLFYSALLTRPVGAMANIYGQTQTAIGTLSRLQSVLSERPENLKSDSRKVLFPVRRIRFENVHFAYPGREIVFAGLNLEILPGEKLALVGANGAGKTALISLLLRYYEPRKGRIFFDEKDISTLNVADIRSQLGLVPQTPFLFNGTIRDNIAFGAESPSELQIERAANLAQASNFISGLEQGMDTIIGNNGIRLSGGQRQRISLARALIKEPSVLIFDEATSMFDDEGEQQFVTDFKEAMKGRTVILVTHRPASLATADRIVIIEGGVAIRGPA